MKTLTATQQRHNARKDIAEVILFEIQPQGSGGTEYFSTHNIKVGGQWYLRYVKAWSGLSRTAERITSQSKNPDIRIEFLNKFYRGFGFLSQYVDLYSFTYAPITIKRVTLDAFGNQSETETVFVGRVDSIDAEDRETFSCGVSHLSYYLTKVQAQKTVNLSEYPLADARSISRVIPWNFGNLPGVPLVGVNPGAVTTLAAPLLVGQTTAQLTEAQGELVFPNSGSAMVDGDTFSWTGKTGHQLTGVTGVGVNHNKGAQVGVVQSYYDYVADDEPIGGIAGVLVDGIRQSSGYTAYTGQPGSQHPLYPTKPGVRFNVIPTIAKQVNVALLDPGHAHQLTSWTGNGSFSTSGTQWTASVNPGWTVNQWVKFALMDSDGHLFLITSNGANYLNLTSAKSPYTFHTGVHAGAILQVQTENVFHDTVTNTQNIMAGTTANALCDQNTNSWCMISVNPGHGDTARSFAVSDKGYIVGVKLCASMGDPNNTYNGMGYVTVNGGAFGGQNIYGGGNGKNKFWTTGTLTKNGVVTWSDIQNSPLRFTWASGNACACWEQWIEVYYVPYGSGSAAAG